MVLVRITNLIMKPSAPRVSFRQRSGNRSDELSWGEFYDRYAQLLFRYAWRCGASLDSELRYTFHTKIVRDIMEAEHDWPVWLQISN